MTYFLKRKVFFILFLSFFLTYHVTARELIVKCDRNYPPYEYEENGVAKGFNVDVFKKVADLMKIDYKIIPEDFAALRKELEDGKIDVATGVFYSKERSKKFDFSVPHSYVFNTIFIRKDSKIRGLKYIRDKIKVGVQDGDYMYDYLKEKKLDVIAKTYKTQLDALLSLKNGKVEAVFGGYITGRFFIINHKINGIINTNEMIEQKKYCFAVKKGNEELLETLNEGLLLIRETGEYKKIKDNWFTPYEEESLTIRDILKNSLYFSPILIIVILLYFWNKTLEKKVRKNTAEVLYLNSLLQQIFLKIPFGCLIFHKDSNKVQLINSKMKDILEIEKDEDVNGKDLYEIFSNVKMYRRCPARNNGDRCPFYMKNVLEIDFNIDHELELITENGKIFNIYLNILPVYQEKSDIKSFMLIFNDFTQKKRLNDILVQNEKMMSLGGLAAGMAHEINNPLSGIAQAAENILRRLSEDNEKNIAVAEELGVNLEDINSYTRKRKIPIFVDDIKKSTLKAAEIIRNMLSFSKNSRSEQDDIFLFSKVVEEAVMLAQKDYDFKRQYDFKTIKIKKELDEELLIKGNRNQIEQVIFNMLKNSAYAIHKKQPEEPEIQLHLKKEKDQAVLKITDNGIGISDDVKKHIFEPFFSTKGVNEGTGLGLSVSFFIIKEKHNGTIEISSNKGEGTTFFIMLPAVDDSNTKE